MDVVQQLQKITWCKDPWDMPSISDEAKALLQQCAEVTPREMREDVQDIISNSQRFPAPFPIDTVRLFKLKLTTPVERLHDNIASTYPLVHERTLLLMANFLLHKRQHGSSVEKALYSNMSILDLIDRILKKRALVFMKKQDVWKLLSGEKGQGGWEAIGTDAEKPPLVLAECLSYDELKLSALVSVSGPTVCINDGARTNAGVVRRDGVESEAIIIGIIGPRFQRPGRMECEDLLITEEQNTAENGYGPAAADSVKRLKRQLWEEFYQISSSTYSAVAGDKLPVSPRSALVFSARFARRPRSAAALDAAATHRRLALLADLLLLEADARASAAKKPAFLNVIGAGLGVWKISPHQVELYVLSFLIRVHALLTQDLLNNVSDVNFAYIKPAESVLRLFKKCKNTGDDSADKYKLLLKSDSHPRGGVAVWVWRREPAARLDGPHAGKLLVLSYAWDSNAHPGNEFWLGKLTSSGDGAAASSTQVSELHSAHISPAVCARGLLHVAPHCRQLLAGSEHRLSYKAL